jgi:hypothetical protein
MCPIMSIELNEDDYFQFDDYDDDSYLSLDGMLTPPALQSRQPRTPKTPSFFPSLAPSNGDASDDDKSFSAGGWSMRSLSRLTIPTREADSDSKSTEFDARESEPPPALDAEASAAAAACLVSELRKTKNCILMANGEHHLRPRLLHTQGEEREKRLPQRHKQMETVTSTKVNGIFSCPTDRSIELNEDDYFQFDDYDDDSYLSLDGMLTHHSPPALQSRQPRTPMTPSFFPSLAPSGDASDDDKSFSAGGWSMRSLSSLTIPTRDADSDSKSTEFDARGSEAPPALDAEASAACLVSELLSIFGGQEEIATPTCITAAAGAFRANVPETFTKISPSQIIHSLPTSNLPRKSSLKKIGSVGSMNRSVNFGNLKTREYNSALSDPPSCWSYRDKQSVAVDEYEEKRSPRRRPDQMVLSFAARRKLPPKREGYIIYDLEQAMKKVECARKVRPVTERLPLTNIAMDGLVDVCDNVMRGFFKPPARVST